VVKGILPLLYLSVCVHTFFVAPKREKKFHTVSFKIKKKKRFQICTLEKSFKVDWMRKGYDRERMRRVDKKTKQGTREKGEFSAFYYVQVLDELHALLYPGLITLRNKQC